MTKDTANMIFGQRISSQINLDNTQSRFPDWLLVEIPVGPITKSEEIFYSLFSAQSKFLSSQVLPILNIDFLACGEELPRIFEGLACVFRKLKIFTVVVAADEDNQAIRIISPRNQDKEGRDIMVAHVENVISFFVNENFNCIASLTVEELCPGGIDPLFGVVLANRFVNAGASGLIASGGTIDFPHLKFRRKTKLKSNTGASVLWPEMWLSSAYWLVSRVKVPVFAQGEIDDVELSLAAASEFGMRGIIDSSVNCPSSNLSIADPGTS